MKVDFRYGTYEELKARIVTPGNFYIITDTQEIYYDTPEGVRIRLYDYSALTGEEIDKLTTK